MPRSTHRRSAVQVERKVNSSDSRGTLSTNGATAQPSPRGMERVSVDRLYLHSYSAVALLITPVSILPPRKPCSSLAPSARSLGVPGESISAIRVLREML